MTRKMSDAEAKRTPLNLRTTAELRRKLDKAAADEGRSITQEVERRLERSFDRPSDPLRDVFSDDTRRFLREQRNVALLFEIKADVFMYAMRITKEREFDEIETRTTLQAAMDVINYYYLWRPGDTLQMDEDASPQGARLRDLPPKALGYRLATSRIAWWNDFLGEGASVDTAEDRVMDIYSGLGLNTVYGSPPADRNSDQPRRSIEEIMGR